MMNYALKSYGDKYGNLVPIGGKDGVLKRYQSHNWLIGYKQSNGKSVRWVHRAGEHRGHSSLCQGDACFGPSQGITERNCVLK